MQFPTFFLLAALISSTFANPIPADGGPFDDLGCANQPSTTDVVVTNKQIGIDGNPVVGAGTCTPKANTPCTVEYAISYTVSLTVSVGIAPSSPIGGLGVDVSWSTEKGSVDNLGSDCPVAPAGADQWTCGLNIFPSVVRISGTQTTSEEDNLVCKYMTDQPFTVDAPIINNDGNPNIRTELCACQDRVGWASPGAPPLCGSPCATA